MSRKHCSYQNKGKREMAIIQQQEEIPQSQINQMIIRQQIMIIDNNKIVISMRHGTTRHERKPQGGEEHRKEILQQLNASVVVLKYIEPPRELLKSNNRMNCVYKKQFNALPHIFKCCEELHPLAENAESLEYLIDPELFKNIYKRDLELKINPFQMKSYFRSTMRDFRKATTNKQQFNIHSQEEQVSFDSNFESGNLLSVDKQIGKQNCYHLMMQNDINTYGCTQWFFYKASNRKSLEATFFINNFYKPQSLYKKGMKILIFSMKKYLNQEVGWVRGGQQIIYFRNSITQKKPNGETKQFYSLKFNYRFQYQQDDVYFAYSYPYTFSRLTNFLSEKDKAASYNFYNCRLLCTTVAQNKIFLVTITDNSIPKTNKSSIFLTSRVHPGQTVSSLIMQGVINFLTSNDPIAIQLRRKFIFKLVPMMNPDGVIHGNYRTNLAGIDLNRVWDSADSELSPQIFQIKKHITEFNKQCPIIMFCDLHGHSARKSAFIYGCESSKIKYEGAQEQSRLFPFMLSFLNEDFRFKSCNFSVQKNKKGTARIQLWKQLKIPNIFTLEASFCSAENSEYHFRPTDYSEIGVSFCKNIHQYFLNNPKKKQFQEKLRNSKQYNLLNKGQSDDSESDNDLLDIKTITKLKNGENVEIWNKRKMLVTKLPIKTNEELKQIKAFPRKRYISQSNKRHNLTQGDFEANSSIISFKSKKLISSAIPTKKITIDTEILKPQHLKGYYPANSIFQRIQHNYRGKSSIYRIHRKNLKNITIDSSSKKQRCLLDNSSLDQY